MALFHHIKQQNDRKKNQLDELFIERKEMDNEVQDIEKQINQISDANEQRLSELDPEKRNQYERNKQENAYYMNEVNQMRSELEKVNNQLAKSDEELRQDNLRQRAHHLKRERGNLLRKKEELELLNNESNLPFPEARERLINRIKQDNAEVIQVDKTIDELRKLIDTYQRNIEELETDLAENKTEKHEVNKFDVLQKKDQEMTEFMDTFEQTKESETNQILELEKTIPILLEHMSQTLQKSTALPSKDQMNEMKGDNKFREGQVQDSENTLARVKVEL